MRYFILFLLFATPCGAVEIGELVRLEADTENVIWQVVPETPDFEAVGNKAFFSSRVSGDYLIIIASSEDNKPTLKTQVIHVEGTTGLDSRIKELLKKVISSNGREEAIKLAQSFRAIAGTGIPIDHILVSTAKANQLALGSSLEQWKPFLDGLALCLDELNLQTLDDYQRTWLTIADAIERHVK